MKAREATILLTRIEYVGYENIQIEAECGKKLVYVCGFRTWLLYLSCFGSTISNLTIGYSDNSSKSERCTHIHQYFEIYCVDSLNTIQISELKNLSMKQFVKLFTDVHIMDLEDCDLGKNLPQFAKRYPNLRQLRLRRVRLAADFDRVNFSHLKELIITGYDRDTPKCIAPFTAFFLDSNRQLQTLVIHSREISLNELLNMIKYHS